MRAILLTRFAAPLLFAFSSVAIADATSCPFSDYPKVRESGKISHVLEIDNDTLLLNRNDGFYTSGMRYARRHALRDGEILTVFGWRIGQELYTASDIKLPPEEVGAPDHPYAGWLFGGFFKEVHHANGTRKKFGIDIGCIGPCAGGEWTQTQFHRIIDQPLPKAWSRQVKNEFGVVLYAEMAPVRWTLGPSVDLTPSFNARFGNIYTDAGAGLLLRAGQPNVLPGLRTLHAFLRADARAVGYNATLQGGYFSNGNPHTVDPKRFVGEGEIGMVWAGETFGTKLSLVRRSNEIRGLPNSEGAQNYLQLQFSYSP
ncbi:MAG TPA: lipid A deacylase LpxR family protein [Noviherbaspirillum sp.]|nr:lipid A deacylase LpxR family protein [Noviherbaspirillum sp.]